MTELIITVVGLTSRACAKKLEKMILTSFRVRRARASLASGECSVISREPLDKDALAEAMEKYGFEAVGFIEKPYERQGILEVIRARKAR